MFPLQGCCVLSERVPWAVCPSEVGSEGAPRLGWQVLPPGFWEHGIC